VAEPGSLPADPTDTAPARRAGRLAALLSAARRFPAAAIHHPLRAGIILVFLVGLGIGACLGGRQAWAWHHRRAAKQAAERGDFQQAWLEIAAPLEVWPGDPHTHFLAARYARRADRLRDADQHLNICQNLEGVTPENGFEGALLRAQQGALTEVENALHSRVINKDPDTVLIFEALAKGYIVVYRLNDAMICLGQLLEQDPDHGPALVMRGRILNAAERALLAIEDFRRAVKLYPTRDDWRQELAELLMEHHFPNEALPLLQDLRTRSSAPEVLLDLARAWRQTGEPEQAHQVLIELLAAHPNHADGLAEKGQLAKEAGHADAAEPLLREAYRLDPTSYHIGYSLYECLGTLGKKVEAAALLDELLKRKSGLARVQRIALELTKVGKSATLRHEAGATCMRLSIEDEGLRWLLSALQDDPDHGPTHLALAEYYERHQQPEQASLHRRRAERVGMR
jgi:predicted Zn-dependent protease